MIGPFKLALRYIVYNWPKTLILVGCIFLTGLLPIGIRLLLEQFNQTIMARATATPAVVGAKGSPLDLTLHALYYKASITGDLFAEEITRIRETGLAEPIPISTRHTARKQPIVATTIDYFDFRELELQSGSYFAMLGECVIGSSIAQSLGLGVGDSLLSDRENVIDIAGLYPLKMKIVGVLAESRSPDDQAVFVDLNTAWVIAGLGHGHEDVTQSDDKMKVLRRDSSNVVATAAVLPYTEVTEENLDSFHFHGDPETFPLTAIIAVPRDAKSKVILEGQYLDHPSLQFVIPQGRIEELMNMVFRIKLFFDANSILVTISTLMLLSLVIVLSLKLRQKEMQTMFRLGCSRGTIFMLQAWELTIVLMMALILIGLAIWGLQTWGAAWMESLLLRF